MRVGISIPDAIFAEAESLAKRFNLTRSDLYSRALHAFIGQHAPNNITEAMNAVVATVGSETDLFGAKANRLTIESTEW